MFIRAFRISQLTQSKCYIAAIESQHPYRCHRLKSDIVTPNNAIDNLYLNNEPTAETIAPFDHTQQRKPRPSTDATLPFDAIPCADPTSVSRFQRIAATMTLVRRMMNGNWEHRFHEDIDQLHTQLGPIFRQTHCGHQVVFVKSPQMLRDVFTFEGKYPKHPLPEAWTFYNRLHRCERGLFFMDDAEWMETRKQLAPLMLRNEDRFAAAIECATDHLLEQWQVISDAEATTADGFVELPQVLTSLYGWSIRVLLATMFGVNASRDIYVKLGSQIDAFAEVVQHVFDDTVPLSSISPQTARKLRLGVWRKFEKSVTDTLAIAGAIIEYGCQQQHQLHGEHSLLGEMRALGMTSEMIQRVFVDFVIAAGDTTAFTTQWAMYALAQQPHVQQAVRQEVFHMAANRFDGPLMRGTVRETLRLYPAATFIGRILAKDAVLGNFRLNKHTLVYISMYSAGRDEQSFPKANSFVPSRWNRNPITGTLEQVSHAQSFVPFALGARNCIGQRIANAQMHVILSKLLRKFELKLLNESEIDVVMRLIISPSRPIRFAVRKI